jgi:hypothetical protein
MSTPTAYDEALTVFRWRLTLLDVNDHGHARPSRQQPHEKRALPGAASGPARYDMGRVLIAGVLRLAAAAVPVPLLHGRAAQAHQNVSRPVFEVATIKQSAQLDSGGTLRMQPGGLFRSVNVSVRNIMIGAYRTADRMLFQRRSSAVPRGWRRNVTTSRRR